ncbi:MAG: 5'-nucleotidase C-terminal domain-containing protein [Saprospiraceae bacterium]|nr:5'-nucleotidase C-terminal domain-containing protein [Saprospiraceae bacterium]
MRQFLLSLCLLALVSCQSSRSIVSTTQQNIEFTILQINDVYEIAPLEGGKAGGLARVATIKKQLLAENPNTIAILAGDFLSPSFIGTLKDEAGERIAGMQMVETLNAMGLDYATFGNHEFDISDPAVLQKRIDASQFEYTICNVRRIKGDKKEPFTQKINGVDRPIPSFLIREFTNGKGQSMKVGFIGVLLPFSQQDYLHYDDVTESFRQAYNEVKDKVDVVIGITHLDVADDQRLAAAVPGVSLFIGGHDHTEMNHYVEKTVITKADANAKTAYIHRFTYNPPSKMVQIQSSIQKIDESIADEPTTQKVVGKWQSKVDQLMSEMGFDPNRQVLQLSQPLICKESLVRTQPTNYGQLAALAMSVAIPSADVYLLNSGSMRLDDNLSNVVTEYDVLRTFPFGGSIVKMEIPGIRLQELLNIGLKKNKGDGGYLQQIQAVANSGNYLIKGKELEKEKMYTIVLPQFLAKGREQNLEFLGEYTFQETPELELYGSKVTNDIRNIVIAYFKQLKQF